MAISPITGNYTVGKGLIFFQPSGSSVWEELGDIDNFDLTVEVEEIERYSNQYGVAKLAHSAVIQTDVSIEMTLMQMTDRNRALSVGGDKAAMSQSALTSQSVDFTGVAAGDVFDIGALSLTNVSVEDDTTPTPVAWTLDTDYELDADAGMLKVLQIPGASSTNITVAYDTAAISSGLQVGIGGNANLRGALRLRGVNTIGVKSLIDLWDVQLRPSGSASFISSEYRQISLTGRAFAATGKASGYEYGQERTL